MRVTRLGRDFPLLQSGYGATTQIPTGGDSGQVPTSNGSNGVYYGPNVATITANGSNTNTLIGPFVNFAAGSNIQLSTGSNTLTIHSTGGGSSLTTKDEGITLSSAVTTLDFVGAGVTASGAGATTTVTISGGGSSPSFHGARVYNNAAIPVNPSATLTFNSERYDTDAYHDPGSNPSRLTIPSGLGGKYSVGVVVEWAANATGYRQLGFFVNGTTFIGLQRWMAVTTGGEETRQMASTDYTFAVGDWVEVVATQNSGGSLNITAGGNYSPEFTISYLGA